VVNDTTLCDQSISERINKKEAKLTEISTIKRLISIFPPSFGYRLSIVDTDAISTFIRPNKLLIRFIVLKRRVYKKEATKSDVPLSR